MNKRLTAEEIGTIRKRAEKATEGRWVDDFGSFTDEGISIWSHGRVQGGEPVITTEGGVQNYNDADFIANARQDIPALLAEVERLRSAIDNAASFLPDGENRLANRYLCEALGVNENHYGFFGEDDEE